MCRIMQAQKDREGTVTTQNLDTVLTPLCQHTSDCALNLNVKQKQSRLDGSENQGFLSVCFVLLFGFGKAIKVAGRIDPWAMEEDGGSYTMRPRGGMWRQGGWMRGK